MTTRTWSEERSDVLAYIERRIVKEQVSARLAGPGTASAYRKRHEFAVEILAELCNEDHVGARLLKDRSALKEGP